MEDFVGTESETEDLFSDDDGPGKDNKLSPNANEINTSNVYQLDSPVFPFHDQDNIETPGKPVIPKTPLGLVPFMTKENVWTSDLETPVTDKNSKKNSDYIDKIDNDNYHECTPKNASVFVTHDEVIPGSPVVSSKKTKRRTKRRIFNKDIIKNSSIDDTNIDISDNYNNLNKENSSKKTKSNSQIEIVNNNNNSVPEIHSLIKKYENFRESCFNNKNNKKHEINFDQSNDICDDIFVNNIKALETADKIYCKNKNNKNSIVEKQQDRQQEYISFTKICQDLNEEKTSINNEKINEISSVTFSTWNTYETLDNINEFDDNFRGFTEEEQSQSQNLLLKFERLFQYDKEDNFDDIILTQKINHNDSLSFEKYSSNDEQIASQKNPLNESLMCNNMPNNDDEPVVSQDNALNESLICQQISDNNEPVTSQENALNKTLICEKNSSINEPSVSQENVINELLECEKMSITNKPIVSQESNFHGFLDFEKLASSDAAEKIRLHYESYVDKVSDKLNNINRIYLEPQPLNEPILLPPIGMRIKTEFINAFTKKELLIDLNKVNSAWSLMTYEYNIDKLISNNTQLNLSSNIIDNLKSPLVNNNSNNDNIDLNNITIIEDDNSNDNIKINSEFKTAAGKELIIDKTALTKADSLLRKDVEKIETDDNLNQAGIAAVFYQQNNFNKSNNDVLSNEPINKVPDNEALMAQPIKFNTFETSHLNNQKKTIEKINNKSDVNICSDKFQKTDVPTNVQFDTLNFEKLSTTFTWGHGKSVNISEKALALAAKQFNDVSEEDSLKILEKETTNNSVSSKTPLIKRTPGGFVSHRKSLGLINDTPKNTTLLKTPTITTTTTPLGFSTSKGKTFNVSKNSLLKAQAKFNDDDDDNKINKTKLPVSNFNSSLPSTSGGFRNLISRNSLPKIKLQFNEDFSDIKNNITPNLNDLKKNNTCFTTAKGSSINLSENVLLKAKSIFNEDDLNCLDESCLLDIKNLKKKIESKSIGTGDSVKRKISLDDITPFGRKKLRLGTSTTTDFQARKLFDEIDKDDDCQLISLNKNKTIDLNDTLTDELSAATAAFEEDDRLSLSSLDDINNLNNNDTKKTPTLSSSSPSPSTTTTTTTTDLKNNNENLNKKSLSPNYHESIPDDLVFDTQYSFDEKILINNNNIIDKNILSNKIKEQENIIKLKKNKREKSIIGYILKLKLNNNINKIKLKDLNNNKLPLQRNNNQIENDNIDIKVLTIDSTNASTYKFNLNEFNNDKKNIGIELNDGVYLLSNEYNIANIDDFKRSFLASPGVDPNLLPNGWFENHYKWIVWKLASMDKLNFNKLKKTLTPQNIMGQLKYRYDREIDRTERSSLRRIMEKDDVSTKRIVLCVSRIISTTNVNDNNKPIFELELTDGWYSIITTIDNTLNYYVNNNKIKIGTKLMIYGGQLLNLDDGTYPLDASNNVRFKITANSTRRVKWYTKLGYQLQNGPMKINLKNIKPNGGLIGKIIVSIARIYPLLYREKLINGDVVYRNIKCEEKEITKYEKECQLKIDTMSSLYQLKKSDNEINNKIIKRDVSSCLKILITDGYANAIMTIWSSAEECSQILKETSCIEIINANANGMHSKELQLTTNRWTKIHEYNKNNKYYKNINFPIRCFTPINDITINFLPAYNEFDTIGIIVSIGPAPHGMKNFETMNIAYKNNNNIDSYLSILFWQGISAYGYSEISNIGSFVLFKNLQWRRNTNRCKIPVAFCSERTIITKNSRQITHLRDEYDKFIKRIDNIQEYINNSADKIRIEITKKISTTTPIYCPTTLSSNTPECDAKSKLIKNKIDKLKSYGPAPSLSPINITISPRVSLDYRSPIIDKKKP